MKTIKLLLLSFLLSGLLNAQDCGAALLLNEGTLIEYEQFDKKGKSEGKVTHKTKSLTTNGGKITAQIDMNFTGKSKKDQFDSSYTAHCENGVISIDMIRFFNNTQLSQYDKANMDIEIDGDVLEFPINMNEGDMLNNGTISVKVNTSGVTIANMVMNITDRKILNTESVTTTAGTFKCQKVSYNFETKIGIIKVRGTATEWYHKNKVLIKSESYNKKGKLIGSTELTAMK